MLGDPVAVVAETVGEARQIERVGQRLSAGGSLGDWRLVKDREAHEPMVRSVLKGAATTLSREPSPG